MPRTKKTRWTKRSKKNFHYDSFENLQSGKSEDANEVSNEPVVLPDKTNEESVEEIFNLSSRIPDETIVKQDNRASSAWGAANKRR